jgi:GH25 family lysozyme M1 (1,4-beta-N-acetylmuramidase)
MVSFADLSHHQEDVSAATDVDLVSYLRAGHDRIAFKATQGLSFVDPMFATWWRAAGRLGLVRVAYHYAEAEHSGADEFDRLLAIVIAAGGLGPTDRLCLDIEDDDSATARARADGYCREFTSRAVARGQTSGLVYTGRWYAEPNHIRADDVAPGWRRLWLADYSSAADGAIRLPIGWTRSQVAARQFGDAIRVPGVRRPCDYNRVLADWLGAGRPQPEEEDDMPTAEEIRAIVHDEIGDALRLMLYGDDRNESKDRQTHPDNLQRLRQDLEDPARSPLLKAQAAQASGIAALQATVSAIQRRLDGQLSADAATLAAAGQLDLAPAPDPG